MSPNPPQGDGVFDACELVVTMVDPEPLTVCTLAVRRIDGVVRVDTIPAAGYARFLSQIGAPPQDGADSR